MKNQVRRSVSVLLGLLLLFSAVCGAPAFKAFAEAAEDAPVATIYLCFCGVRLPYLFGHTWICIANTGDAEIAVGEETLAPGEMLSVGLHTGGGMTFNMEMKQFRGSTVTAVAAPLTAEALQNAENEILAQRWDHYDLLTQNCTHFAAAVWNAATGESYRTSFLPFLLRAQVPAEKRQRLYL